MIDVRIMPQVCLFFAAGFFLQGIFIAVRGSIAAHLFILLIGGMIGALVWLFFKENINSNPDESWSFLRLVLTVIGSAFVLAHADILYWLIVSILHV